MNLETSWRETSQRSVKRVLREEAQAILDFSENSQMCAQAVDLIIGASGPLIVSGIGKSGHIASKIASTFRSLGKLANFLHAAEASHGDLGLVQPGSVVLVLSNSGETPELSDLLHYCNIHGIPVIGLTGGKDSTLARASDVTIQFGPVVEACHNGLAPTTSTTLSLAIGDALAVAVSERLGTAPDDFRKYHPGGKLGARLSSVGDTMRTGNALPIVSPAMSMNEVVVVMSEKALGIAILMANDEVVGVITDGDLRRNVKNLLTINPQDMASTSPVRISQNSLVSDAVELMSEKQISACLVDDENGRMVGLLHIHDCVSAGAS